MRALRPLRALRALRAAHRSASADRPPSMAARLLATRGAASSFRTKGLGADPRPENARTEQ